MLWVDLPFVMFVTICISLICLCIAGIVHESSDDHETIIGKAIRNVSSRKHE